MHHDWKAGCFVALAKSWADSCKISALTPSKVHTEVSPSPLIPSAPLWLFCLLPSHCCFHFFPCCLGHLIYILSKNEFFSSQFSKPVFPPLLCGHRSETSVTSCCWSIKDKQIQDTVKKKNHCLDLFTLNENKNIHIMKLD